MTTAFAKLPLLSSRLFVSLLLTGALLLPACSKSPAQIEKKDFGLGQHYLSEGKVNEAIIEFQNVLKVNPKSVKGRLGLATAYLKKGWTAESMLEFQEVTKEDPLNLDAHLALARYGVNSGQWNAVKPEIAAVLKIDPNNVEGLSDSGERELALGREKEAEASFKKALALSPGAVGALVGMGDLLRHGNHPKQAADFYNRALSSDPKNARALTGLGSIAQAEGKPDEAKDYFRKAIEVDKSDLRARIVYANFLAGSGHADQAIALLKAVPQKAADLRIPVKIAEYEVLLGQNVKAIALMHPLELQKIPLPDIYLVLAKAYQNSRRIPEAMEEATKLSTMDGVPPVMKIVAARVELAGRNPGKAQEILDSIKGVPDLPSTYWQSLGNVASAQNHPSRAQNFFEEGLRRFPGDPRLLLSLVDNQMGRKKFTEAKATLEKLLATGPAVSNYVDRMGFLIAQTKGFKAEIAYFHDMARKYRNSDPLEALYLIALSSNKRLPEAISSANRYLAANPNNQNIRALEANLELQQGNRDKAIALYEKILEINPKNTQVLASLALQEFLSGRYSDSESLYRRALRLVPDDPNLETGLGEDLLAEKQTNAALVSFKKALESNPNQPFALLELGRAEVFSGDVSQSLVHLAPLLKVPFSNERKAEVQWLWGLANEASGKETLAEEAFDQAVRISPKVATYHESLGNFWLIQSRWEKALPELEKAQVLDPKNGRLALQIAWGKIMTLKGVPPKKTLGRIIEASENFRKAHSGDIMSGIIEARAYLMLKEPDKALSVYDSILASTPSDRSALLGKADILLSRNDVKGVKKIAQSLLSSNPDDVQAHLLMSLLDQKSNDMRGVASELQRVHQLLPQSVRPALSLASTDLQLGRFEEAKSVAFELYETHPDLYRALFIKASAEMGLGEYRNAMSDFKSLSRHDRNPGPMLNLASVAAEKMGDRSAAKRLLSEAFRQDSEDPGILNNMAFSMAQEDQDLSRALGYAKKALVKLPQPFVRDTVGFVLYRMGRYNKADGYFTEAYNTQFRDPEFLYHMGLNEWKLGNNKKAEGLLRKAVTSGKLSRDEQAEANKALGLLSKS